MGRSILGRGIGGGRGFFVFEEWKVVVEVRVWWERGGRLVR